MHIFAHRKVSMFTLDRFGILLMLSYSCVLLIDTFTKGDMVNSYIHNIGILLGIASMLFATRGIVGVNRAKRYLLWRRDFWMMSQNGVSIHYCPSPVV